MPDDAMTRLVRADPARGIAVGAGQREALLERLMSADTQRRVAERRRPKWRPRRSWLAAALPAGGLAIAGAIAAVVTLLGGGAATVGAAAAAALRDTAAVARSQPATTVPQDGRYLYVKVTNVPTLAFGPKPPVMRGIRSKEDYGFSAQVPNVQEIWQGASGGRQRISNGQAVLPTERDRVAWIAAGRPRLPGGDVHEDRLGPLEPLDLPTDPDALYARLESEAADRGPGRYAYMFNALVGDTLSDWRATPAQRAALFEVAARIPGVELLGPRRDPAGREGLGFAMRDELGAYRGTLIIDPATADLLAKTFVTLSGNAIPEGTVTSTQIYDTPEVVDAIGERPAA